MRHGRVSIATLVIITLVAVAIVLLGTLGAIGYSAERDRQLQKLRSELATNADQLATGLSLPVWNFDRDQIDKVVESIMSDEDVYGVVVKLADVRGTVHARVRDTHWAIAPADKVEPMEGLISEVRNINTPDEKLGTVQIFATTRFVEADLRRTFYSILATTFSLALILSFGLYLLLWRMVLRPLRDIEQFAVTVSSGKGGGAQLHDTVFRGELDSVRSSIQAMVAQLDGRYAALRESNEQFRQLIQRSPLSTAINSGEGTLEYVNDRFVATFGYTLEDIPTLSAWWERAYPDAEYRQVVMATWQNAVKKAAQENTDIGPRVSRVTCKDGKIRVVEIFAVTVGNKNLVMLNDITERARAEEALRLVHSQLEQRIQERTAELVAANERLTELDRLKSQFLATMSHELRTPLNSIIGFTGLLKEEMAGPVNEEQKKQLGMVYGSAQHLLSLISDLLDLSRIEAGKMELDCEDFDYVDVVTQVAEGLKPLARQKGIEIQTDLTQDKLVVNGDRKRCYQVLLNVVNNAVKFTERGTVRVSVHAENGMLNTSVTDTGIGIKPEQILLLFEAFRQVDGSAKRMYEGTGLGLYLCRKLLTIMGGQINVQSEYGKGSCFAFTVPLKISKSHETAVR